MGGYAQATTNGAGLRLISGMDLWGMKIQETGNRIDVWKLQSRLLPTGQKLGDLLGPVEKFDQLARLAVSEGHGLREPVLMRKGASHQRLQVGKKEYLKQSYRFYSRNVVGED
tara:strand:- start:71 stop:409 length:339 start_codon:yes stop_codon:yes gene_type:complete